MLRGVFAAYFTLLHIAGHKPIDTKQKTKRRMEVKLKHTSQPATREVSVFIGAFFEQTCFSGLIRLLTVSIIIALMLNTLVNMVE